MKSRQRTRVSPLSIILLLGLYTTSSALSAQAISEGSARIEHRAAVNPPADPPLNTLTKPVVGTVDAPVDGLDGKPHAGPFVDTPDSVYKNQEPYTRFQTPSKQVPEDGVMNDPGRERPKFGTTGTEGGVTEKERNRMMQEELTGEKAFKTPDPPKELPLANSEHPAASKSASTQVTDSPSRRADAGEDLKVKGFAGLEKPTDLPEKPYDIPHPEPERKGPDASLDPTIDDAYAKNPLLDSDEESEDEEGIHDIIPWDSLFGSFSSIAATEIGDKTFIVAALMAMRHSRLQVFSAAFSALFIMTILSSVAGHALGHLISKRWSAVVAALLFLVFGGKSLREGFEMSPDQGVSDEIREVEAELEEKEVDMARQARRGSAISPYALEAGRAGTSRRSRSRSHIGSARRSPSPSISRSPSPSKPTITSAISGVKNLFALLLSPAWVETFSMTFVGELGDRSQIATVAMAAGQEYLWVMVGASIGHFLCTGIAVLGGSVFAGRVSLRKVTLAGGAIFIAFGIFTLFEAAQYWM